MKRVHHQEALPHAECIWVLMAPPGKRVSGLHGELLHNVRVLFSQTFCVNDQFRIPNLTFTSDAAPRASRFATNEVMLFEAASRRTSTSAASASEEGAGSAALGGGRSWETLRDGRGRASERP